MSKTVHSKVLIIGSGPAGYTAAIYAARANLKPMIISGMQPGGQMTITSDVENYPGFAKAVQGPWLMDQMREQAAHVGTEIISDTITDVDFTKKPFTATGDSGTVYTGDSVIIATGATARWLGLPSEKTFSGRGVSACATCDGFFFKGQEVAVIGGGNSAVEEALYLSQICKKVTLIHRRDSLRAEKIGQDRLFAKSNIDVVWDSVVEEVVGDASGVTGLKLKNLKTGSNSTLPVTGMFVAIGHDPATTLFKGKLKMDAEGYIITPPGSTATSVPGVFAAGDVVDKVYRQAVVAAGAGCMAALDADRYLAHEFAPSKKKQPANDVSAGDDLKHKPG